MTDVHKIIIFTIVFLAVILFFALGQENVEISSEIDYSVNFSEESQETNLTETEKMIDFQVSTNFERVKIKRGESVQFFVAVKNTGNRILERLTVSLALPDGLTSDDAEKYCENLEPGNTCQLNFLIHTSVETQVGKKQVKVSVRYG